MGVISLWTLRAESVGWGLLFFAEEKTDREKIISEFKALQETFQTVGGVCEQLQARCIHVILRKWDRTELFLIHVLFTHHVTVDLKKHIFFIDRFLERFLQRVFELH